MQGLLALGHGLAEERIVNGRADTGRRLRRRGLRGLLLAAAEEIAAGAAARRKHETRRQDSRHFPNTHAMILGLPSRSALIATGIGRNKGHDAAVHRQEVDRFHRRA